MITLVLAICVVVYGGINPWLILALLVAALIDSTARELGTRTRVAMAERNVLGSIRARLEAMERSTRETLERTAMPGDAAPAGQDTETDRT